MPNKNAWNDYKMEQMNKGFWLMQENAEKAKRASDPIEKLADQKRREIRAQAQAEYQAKNPPKNTAEIGCIKVLRDLKANHPLSSGH